MPAFDSGGIPDDLTPGGAQYLQQQQRTIAPAATGEQATPQRPSPSYLIEKAATEQRKRITAAQQPMNHDADLQHDIDGMANDFPLHRVLATLKQEDPDNYATYAPQIASLYHQVITKHSTRYRSLDPDAQAAADSRVDHVTEATARLRKGMSAQPDTSVDVNDLPATAPERIAANALNTAQGSFLGNAYRTLTGREMSEDANPQTAQDAANLNVMPGTPEATLWNTAKMVGPDAFPYVATGGLAGEAVGAAGGASSALGAPLTSSLAFGGGQLLSGATANAAQQLRQDPNAPISWQDMAREVLPEAAKQAGVGAVIPFVPGSGVTGAVNRSLAMAGANEALSAHPSLQGFGQSAINNLLFEGVGADEALRGAARRGLDRIANRNASGLPEWDSIAGDQTPQGQTTDLVGRGDRLSRERDITPGSVWRFHGPDGDSSSGAPLQVVQRHIDADGNPTGMVRVYSPERGELYDISEDLLTNGWRHTGPAVPFYGSPEWRTQQASQRAQSVIDQRAAQDRGYGDLPNANVPFTESDPNARIITGQEGNPDAQVYDPRQQAPWGPSSQIVTGRDVLPTNDRIELGTPKATDVETPTPTLGETAKTVAAEANQAPEPPKLLTAGNTEFAGPASAPQREPNAPTPAADRVSSLQAESMRLRDAIKATRGNARRPLVRQLNQVESDLNHWQQQALQENPPSYTADSAAVVKAHRERLQDVGQRLTAARARLLEAHQAGADTRGYGSGSIEGKNANWVTNAPDAELHKMMGSMAPTEANEAFKDAAHELLAVRQEGRDLQQPDARQHIADEMNHYEAQKRAEEDIPAWTESQPSEKPPESPQTERTAPAAATQSDKHPTEMTHAEAVDHSMKLQAQLDEANQRERTDAQTGLPNWLAYNERVAKNPPASQVYFDLDGLKYFNDRHGHAAGDSLIDAIANAIKQAKVEGYRKSGSGAGDEFVAVFDHPDDAHRLMAEVGEHLKDTTFRVHSKDGRIYDISGGGFSYGEGSTLGDAEAALYAHKYQREQTGERSRDRGGKPGTVVESRVGTWRGRDENPGDLSGAGDQRSGSDERSGPPQLTPEQIARNPHLDPSHFTGEPKGSVADEVMRRIDNGEAVPQSILRKLWYDQRGQLDMSAIMRWVEGKVQDYADRRDRRLGTMDKGILSRSKPTGKSPSGYDQYAFKGQDYEHIGDDPKTGRAILRRLDTPEQSARQGLGYKADSLTQPIQNTTPEGADAIHRAEATRNRGSYFAGKLMDLTMHMSEDQWNKIHRVLDDPNNVGGHNITLDAKEQEALNLAKQMMKEAGQEGERTKLFGKAREVYAPRRYEEHESKVLNGATQGTGAGSDFSTYTPSSKARVFDYMHEAEAAGFHPRYDIRMVANHYNAIMKKVAAADLLDSFRGMKDDQGRPMVMTVPDSPAHQQGFTNQNMVPRGDIPADYVTIPGVAAFDGEHLHPAIAEAVKAIMGGGPESAGWYRGLMALKAGKIGVDLLNPAVHLYNVKSKALLKGGFASVPNVLHVFDGLLPESSGLRKLTRNTSFGLTKTAPDIVGRQLLADPKAVDAMLADGLHMQGSKLATIDEIMEGEPPKESLFRQIDRKAFKGLLFKVQDALHEVCWTNVGELQAGLWHQMKSDMVAAGIPEDQAGKNAAYTANLLTGLLNRTTMGQKLRMGANLGFLSKSWTMGNLKEFDIAGRQLAGKIIGRSDSGMAALPPDMRGEAGQYVSRLITKSVVADMVTQKAILTLAGGIMGGLLLGRWQGSADNDEGRKNRVLIGVAPDGTREYMQVPVAKFTEDATESSPVPLRVGNVQLSEGDALQHWQAKLSPMAKGIWEMLAGHTVGAQQRQIYRSTDKTPAVIGKAAAWLLASNLPDVFGAPIKNAITGGNAPPSMAVRTLREVGTAPAATTIARAVALATGASISHGAPGGPEFGEMAKSRKAADDVRTFDVEPQVRQIAKAGGPDMAKQIADVMRNAKDANGDPIYSRRDILARIRSATTPAASKLQKYEAQHPDFAAAVRH